MYVFNIYVLGFNGQTSRGGLVVGIFHFVEHFVEYFYDTVESTRIEPFLGENRVILD